MSESLVSSLPLGILVFGAGYVFLNLVPKMWGNIDQKRRRRSVKDDVEIRIDAKKKFCQQVRFALRLKRQMKRFQARKKERAMAENE